MKRVRFRPAARRDIDQIYDHSVDRWGRQRADRYVRDLVAAAKGLARGTRIGRSIDEVVEGVWKLRCGSHLLFYREDGEAITVIRILHHRMDWPSRLRR